METKTKEMIKGWIKADGKEGAAKFLSKIVNCSIRKARLLVEEAVS